MTPHSPNFSGQSAHNPGRVFFLDGQNDLPMLEISTDWSRAEIYLHGAHLTGFQKKGQAPLLFMSQCSRFAPDQPIRGGIPVIFPWFGAREGLGMHGAVRTRAWELREIAPATDGSVTVRLRFPHPTESETNPPFNLEYVITVNQSLTLELIATNESAAEPLIFENCLHTYFSVGDISSVEVRGLKGADYLDNTEKLLRKSETADALRIHSEVDRVYLDTAAPVEIHDSQLNRVILIEKENSVSTVVWNPWVAKAQQMPDFGDEEYRQMLCVESGNVKSNRLTLAPGQSASLKVRYSSETLA